MVAVTVGEGCRCRRLAGSRRMPGMHWLSNSRISPILCDISIVRLPCSGGAEHAIMFGPAGDHAARRQERALVLVGLGRRRVEFFDRRRRGARRALWV